MADTLNAIKVAILVTDGFEQVELTRPREALDQAGARTQVVSPKADQVRGWKSTEWGDNIKVDVPLAQARPGDFDALLLPGGVMNPDRLRLDDKAIAFIKAFVDAGKPIAAICHGPWTLINAGGVDGRRMTSWPSLQASGTPAPTGPTRRASSTARWSPAASPTTSRPSTGQWSSCSPSMRAPPPTRETFPRPICNDCMTISPGCAGAD